MAVTGYKKLKLMLSEETAFIRTSINVSLIREYLMRTDNAAPTKAVHPLIKNNDEVKDQTTETK